jgi:hypothetical protein
MTSLHRGAFDDNDIKHSGNTKGEVKDGVKASRSSRWLFEKRKMANGAIYLTV